MANLVVHFEIHASEPQELIDLYSNLLGWRFGSYGEEHQPYWVMRRGLELGATEALPATDWPGIGRGGSLIDPAGNVFGLISPVLSDGTVAMGAGPEA